MKENARKTLSARERLDWLRLIRSENVGPVTFKQLIARYGAAGPALEALPELARRGGRKRALKIASVKEVEREAKAVEALGGRLLASCEPLYPRLLAATEDAPPLLSLLGHPHLLERPAVAIVGARNASANGRKLAERFARELAAAAYLVVSGMARGIDAAAHTGALADGTAAVLAGGLDVVYPPQNAGLYEQIKSEGLLLSEMPPVAEPQARHFPRRNRIISGLSLGVVVVEAAPQSGSLITARMAGEQGREVFALPGSPLDPRAQGCNRLIRDGAHLTESADDVLEVLADLARRPLSEPQGDLFAQAPAENPPESEVEKAYQEILSLLGPSPVTVDELIRQCQLSSALVSLVLMEMELAGRLERQPGGRIALLAEP